MLAGAAVLWLLAALVCFWITFYSAPRKAVSEGDYPMPPGAIYEPFYADFERWMRQIDRWPHESMEIRSFDGLTLRGTYYECCAGAPIELMMPGYRGTARRDLCGGVQRAFLLGHNVLMVDQRGGGKSDGRVITFGIRERYDCLSWVKHINRRFSPTQEIILTGVSMGAATVLMATALPLPDNVVGVLADCGYSSPKAIVQKVLRQLHLPLWPFYAWIRLGGRIFGGFDIESASPVEAMKQCRVPVVFIHGEADEYVPCDMSRENHAACTAPKVLWTVPNAGHGLAFPVSPEDYVRTMQTLLPYGDAVSMPVL